MDTWDVVGKLNALYQSQDILSKWQGQKAAEIQDAIPESVRKAIETIEAAWAEKLQTGQAQTVSIETEIKQMVLQLGMSVKGSALQAVFTPGRISWDSKGIDGFAVAYPELLRFRSIGKPSVSIRHG